MKPLWCFLKVLNILASPSTEVNAARAAERRSLSVTTMSASSLPQVQLYEDFAKSRAKASVEDSISAASTEEEEKPKLKATGHVFQVHLFFLDTVLASEFTVSNAFSASLNICKAKHLLQII